MYARGGMASLSSTIFYQGYHDYDDDAEDDSQYTTTATATSFAMNSRWFGADDPMTIGTSSEMP